MDYGRWVEAVRGGLADLTENLIAFLPKLLAALALLVVGWILARLLGALTKRLAGRMDWLFGNRVVEGGMRRLGVERPSSEVVGRIVFWAVLLLFFTAATEALGLPVIATWIGGLSYYLPRVLVGLLIVFAGLVAGNLAGEAILRAAVAAGFLQAALLGQAAQVAIVLIAVITAVEQLGIDTKFLTATLMIVIGSVIGGVALAFAFGARRHVGNLIAAHYMRQVYQEGQRVRVSGVEGTIARILPTAAMIETADGQVLVPAEEFSATVSVLLSSEA